MKKSFLKAIAVLALFSVLLFLSMQVVRLTNDLEARSFIEGTVVEDSKGGGIVTVSDDWIVYEDDSFITSASAKSKSLKEIYCELHKLGFVKASEGNFHKISYRKEISVKEVSEQRFFLVGKYYITSSYTPISSESKNSEE